MFLILYYYRQNILRFASPYGKIVSFKYLLYTSGVEKGEPRDYCFIEYSTREVSHRQVSIISNPLLSNVRSLDCFYIKL